MNQLEFTRLFDRAHAWSVAYSILRDRDLAEDVAQDAFTAAYHAAPRFVPDVPLTTWVYRIVSNLCMGLMRARRRRATTSLDELRYGDSNDDRGFTCEPVTPRLDPHTPTLSPALREALAELPEKYREALIMRHVSGLEYVEMAKLTGESIGNLRKRVCLAGSMLREQLEARGQSPSVR